MYPTIYTTKLESIKLANLATTAINTSNLCPATTTNHWLEKGRKRNYIANSVALSIL